MGLFVAATGGAAVGGKKRESWDTWTTHLFSESDLNLWAKGRTGLTMPDSKGGSPVQILTPTFRIGGSVNILRTEGGILERLFDGNDHTFYFKTKIITPVDGTNRFPLRMGNNRSAERGLLILSSSGSWITYFSDGVSSFGINQCTTPNTTLVGWINVLMTINQTTKRITSQLSKCSDNSSLGTNINYDISAWTTGANDNAGPLSFDSSYFTYADLKMFDGIKTLSQCRDNSYVDGLKFFYPTLLDRTDVSGNGHHFRREAPRYISHINKYYDTISTYQFDYGYDLLKTSAYDVNRDTYNDVWQCKTPSGLSITPPTVSNYGDAYINSGSHAGNLTEHNLADCLLNIPGDNWDRSDTTIFNDSVRTSLYYDAANPNRWHISELRSLSFSENCNTGFKGLNYFKITDNSLATEDRKLLKEIISYNTNKAGNDIQKILQYTGDKTAIDGMINLTVTTTANTQTVKINLSSLKTSEVFMIFWGDGTYEFARHVDTAVEYTHIYAVTGIYPVKIINSQSIKEFRFAATSQYEAWSFNASQLPLLCPDLEILNLQCTTVASVSGVITGLNKLKYIQLMSPNTLEGDITGWVDVETLRVLGQNKLHGSITPLSKLKVVYVDGENTISGNVSADTHPLIESFEGGFLMPGLNTINGSLSGMTHLFMVCFQGLGSITCNVETTPALVYLSSDESITWSGDISAMINIYLLSVPGLTGSINNLINLRTYYDRSTGIAKQVRFNNHPKLDALRLYSKVYTSEETNQILADMWANRDAAKDPSDVYRIIQITGTPTGQGLIDKANLQAYRSPNNNAAYPLWTVNTL
jgi:hypothetical protein